MLSNSRAKAGDNINNLLINKDFIMTSRRLFSACFQPRLTYAAALLAVAAALSGCHPAGGEIASGEVVSVGKSHLVLKDAHSVMFVTVQESDIERLKELKKGEAVTLVGKEPANADADTRPEIDAVVRSDGTQIPLGR
jgi:hypothetical protein